MAISPPRRAWRRYLLPHLTVHHLEVKPLGEGDYHLNLVVENAGFLPTCTSGQGKNRKAVRPVRLELELPEAVTLVDGRRRVELWHLEGRSNKLDVSSFWTDGNTDNRGRVECTLRGRPGAVVTVHVLSERAGLQVEAAYEFRSFVPGVGDTQVQHWVLIGIAATFRDRYTDQQLRTGRP